MKNLFLIILIGCIPLLGNAQGLKFGFKTGMTISKINGPSEQANGTDLESNTTTGGFMVGAIIGYKFTDLAGIKLELLYNQKGTKYNFEGPGYQVFPTQTGGQTTLTGEQRIDLDVSTSYLDIPIMAYGRVGKFELEGGVSLGLLLSASGSGELEINGVAASGASTGTYNGVLDYRYNRDNPGIVTTPDLVEINVDGQVVNVPKILTAFYPFTTDRGRYYNVLDIGLVGGINYYWNQTLYLGARLNYGLLDVTSNDGYDVSKATLNGGNFITQSDKDQNFSIQISLGFSF